MESGIRIGPEPSAIPPFPVQIIRKLLLAEGAAGVNPRWASTGDRRQARADRARDPVRDQRPEPSGATMTFSAKRTTRSTLLKLYVHVLPPRPGWLVQVRLKGE